VLALQGLTWWGQSIINGVAGEGLGAGEAALAADEGWQYLLGDMLYALECMTGEMTEETAAAVAVERAYAVAFQGWEENDCTGERPTRVAPKKTAVKKTTKGAAKKGKAMPKAAPKKRYAKQKAIAVDADESEIGSVGKNKRERRTSPLPGRRGAAGLLR
jgi:hypothetical protein